MKIKYITISLSFLLVLFVVNFLVIQADFFTKSETGEIQYDHPDKAQLREFKMTMDPALGYPPVERLQLAYEGMKSKFESQRAISEVSWEERGPNNFGGRTRALMFDPNDPTSKKVWAAGVTGGLWYNDDITDVSSSWQKVDDFLPSLAVNNIVYDPNELNTFYFGTGEGWFGGGMVRGSGIWKSVDGGLSWNVLPSTEIESFHFVQKIVVTSESTLLAATRGSNTFGGVFRSEDGGTTWSEVISGRAADIEVVGNDIYASIGIFTEGALYKSSDDGLTWEDISPESNAERIEIAVTPEFPNVVYAIASLGSDVSWFYRSENGGETWISLAVPAYLNSTNCTNSSNDFTRQQAWYDLIIAVLPSDPKMVMVGGIDLHRSTNGGSSWEPISYWTSACETLVHADQHGMVFRPGFPNQALFSNDGGVYFCQDVTVSKANGGPVIEMRNKNFNVTQFYACAAENVAGSDYFLAGAQDNGSHQFNSMGVDATFEITGGDGAFCFVDQDNSDIQITSYVYNTYFVTTDFWEENVTVGDGEKGDFINPADYNSNTNTLFAAGNTGHLLRYAGIGEGEVAEEDLDLGLDGLISAVAVSPYDDNVLFAGTQSGKVYEISDVNGASPIVTEIGTGIATGFVSCVAIGESNDKLLVTLSNYGLASVWLTNDGGVTWLDKEGTLPDMPVRWALFNPGNSEEVLLATELGIWSTNSLSTSPAWEPSNQGLANVRCDMLRYRSSDGLVILATHGRGLYTSDVFATGSLARFYVPQVVAYAGEEMEFINASHKSTSYSWDFGDGTLSTEENPKHTFQNSGSFNVALSVNGDELAPYSLTIPVLPKKSLDYGLEEGGNFEVNQTDFRAVTVSGSGFELGSSTIAGKNGTRSGSNGWILAPSALVYERYSEAYLYSPSYNFSLSGTYSIEFYTKYLIEDEWDYFVVQYSTDNGRNWRVLGEDVLDASSWHNQIAIDQNGIYPPGRPFFSGDTGGEYVKKTLDISFLSNQSTVAFRFAFKSDPASEEAGVAIDDFQLTGPTSTTPNVAFATSSSNFCINSVVEFENSSVGDINSYSWSFGTGAHPSTAVGFGPHEVVYSTTGIKTVSLTASTDSGELIETLEIEITSPPALLEAVFDAPGICKGDTAYISIADSEDGIFYQLYNVTNSIVPVGAPVTGTGGEIFLKSVINSNSMFKVTAENSGGCSTNFDEVISIESKLKPTVNISRSSTGILTASFSGADEYVWFLDGEVIEGANGQSYTPTEQGSFYVGASNGGCFGYSSQLVILSAPGASAISIYPNPTEGILVLNVEAEMNISLHDLSGRVIVPLRSISGKQELNISNLKSGYYLLKTEIGGQVTTQKIYKK